MKVFVNRYGRASPCHVCKTPIERGGQYVRTCKNSFHLTCLRDGRGDLIIKPRTALEYSRSKAPIVRLPPAEGS